MVREMVSGNADPFVGLDKRTIANTVHIRAVSLRLSAAYPNDWMYAWPHRCVG